MNQYALYLRKSRADLDAEARGEGETLAKHRAALTDMAKRRGLLIVREYAEIVSGDTIAARPQMQALLADVKAGMYAGVIVNDVDRLGRGDSIDQEIIKLTFAASHTLIITPMRDIDPANPTDDQMLDFSLFLARAEYKISARRMVTGRARSAAAGNWITGTPPLGYTIHKGGGRITLQPDEATAPIVRMMFDWYARGEAGYYLIAKRLNEMGIKSQHGNNFHPKTVHQILINPAYIGRAAWGRSATVSTIEGGQRVKKRARNQAAPIIVEDAHPAIIERDMWDAVQARAALARHRSPVNTGMEIKSPLAGLIVCSECGHYMQRILSKRRALLVCTTTGCRTSGTYCDIVEGALLDVLRDWCADYAQPMTRPEPVEDVQRREALRHQIDQTDAQLTRAMELVETGVYSAADYISRKTALEARKTALTAELDKLTRKTPEAARAAILPVVRRVIDAYPYAETAEQKNALLRSVVDRVIYHKTHSAKKNEDPAKFIELDVFPVVGEDEDISI